MWRRSAIFCLDGHADRSERGHRAGAAAQHGDEDAALGAAEALHVAAQLVDPDCHLEAEGRGQRVLAVRASRQQHRLRASGEVGEDVEQRGQLLEEHLVRPAHEQELSRLRDVLRRRAPVHVAARVSVADPVELPDERHQRMTGLRQSGANRRPCRGGESCAFRVISSAAWPGMMPSSACAWARAASTSSHA